MATPSTPTSRTPAPFLRWVGGKTRLLESIVSLLPPGFDPSKNRLFEPFVGGGAVMFRLGDPAQPEYVPGKQLVVNDVNPDLIATYTVLRDDVDGLIAELRGLPGKPDQAVFNLVKKSRTTNDLGRAARMVFLNKTCFNGLWRVNSKGEFNVPFGKIANPTICDEELLRACSKRLEKAKIRLGSYSAAVNDAKAGDLVYLDPPYLPLSPSSSFSKYATDDFGSMDHYALAGVIRGLSERGVYVMLSNSDTPLTRQVFGGLLELRGLAVTRTISAASASRGKVGEILGLNYTPKEPASLPCVAQLEHSPSASGWRVP